MSERLEDIAHAMTAEGKGILAADESTGTIKKRFDSIGVESTEENRRGYRDLLFTTEGAEEHISGVILFDETIRQESSDGRTLAKVLSDRGIIPGDERELSDSSPRLKPPRIFKQKQVPSQEIRRNTVREVAFLLRACRTVRRRDAARARRGGGAMLPCMGAAVER